MSALKEKVVKNNPLAGKIPKITFKSCLKSTHFWLGSSKKLKQTSEALVKTF
jgi:hypothetical protein